MNNYLIIGASSGIGKTLAFELANEGHRVWGTFNSNDSNISHPNMVLNVNMTSPKFVFFISTLKQHVKMAFQKLITQKKFFLF